MMSKESWLQGQKQSYNEAVSNIKKYGLLARYEIFVWNNKYTNNENY